MVLLDLLGRRWTLRILWELRHGALTSRALRTACDEASPTVLQARLSELRCSGGKFSSNSLPSTVRP